MERRLSSDRRYLLERVGDARRNRPQRDASVAHPPERGETSGVCGAQVLELQLRMGRIVTQGAFQLGHLFFRQAAFHAHQAERTRLLDDDADGHVARREQGSCRGRAGRAQGPSPDRTSAAHQLW